MKKFIATMLILAVIVSGFSLNVSADTGSFGFTGYEYPTIYSSGSYNLQNSGRAITSRVYIEDFKTLFLENIAQCNSSIDISGYNLGHNDNNTDAIQNYIWYCLPEAFNVLGIGFTYTWSGLITEVNLSYRDFADTPAEYAVCHNKMIAAANKILNDIEGNSKLDDVQKALLLHDRLALWNEYDYIGLEAGDQDIYTAYGALGMRGSVCQGYAMAYMYLLERVGISNNYCSSEALNHGWNTVYINGRLYHVDVTWDDISWKKGERGVVGGVGHENFLRSTQGIYNTGHKANDYDYSPSDTTYDNYFWQNSVAAFTYLNDEIYYIDNTEQKLKRYSDRTALCSVEGEWKHYLEDGSYYDFGNNARLLTDGDALIYSLPDSVYRYDVSNGKSTKIYNADLSGNFSIYGIVIEDEYLICDINDIVPYTSLGCENVYQIKVKYEKPVDNVEYGDANGDGKINGRDYAMLIQHINGANVNITLKNADVNVDGKINGRDYALLIQFINGWDVTLGPKV